MSVFALLSTKTFASDECRAQIVEVAKFYNIDIRTDSFSTHESIDDLLLTPEEFNNLTVYEQEVYYELLKPLSAVVQDYKSLLKQSISEIFQIVMMTNSFDKFSQLIQRYTDVEKALDSACKNI